MTISINQFFDSLESAGNHKYAKFVCDNFINTMQLLNPDRIDMSGADWLSVMFTDYVIETDVNQSFYTLVPKVEGISVIDLDN